MSGRNRPTLLGPGRFRAPSLSCRISSWGSRAMTSSANAIPRGNAGLAGAAIPSRRFLEFLDSAIRRLRADALRRALVLVLSSLGRCADPALVSLAILRLPKLGMMCDRLSFLSRAHPKTVGADYARRRSWSWLTRRRAARRRAGASSPSMCRRPRPDRRAGCCRGPGCRAPAKLDRLLAWRMERPRAQCRRDASGGRARGAC